MPPSLNLSLKPHKHNFLLYSQYKKKTFVIINILKMNIKIDNKHKHKLNIIFFFF
jgi:hypothetical protein